MEHPHDPVTAGELEADHHRKLEQLADARAEGDTLAAHNLAHELHEIEQEIDARQHGPRRLQG
jgi:hypothetical protein